MQGEKIDLSKPVLAIYDIRGIQNYIFRTNRVKEIIGASNIVQDLFETILKESVDSVLKKESDPERYRINWRQYTECRFEKEETVQMEVIYAGGGNTLILYRTRALCRAINRKLSRLILEKTYSLGLAVAVTEKTKDYMQDYRKLQRQLSNIKRKMAPSNLTGNFPVTRQEDSTGYPLSASYWETYGGRERKCSVSREVLYKLCYSTEEEKKKFDDMVTEKGRDSMLAVVHIDGNNLGNRIGNLMKEKGAEGYEEAIRCSRTISNCISRAFEGVYERMIEWAEQWAKKHPKRPIRSSIRKIVSAGDDMTFVCNASLALDMTAYFLKEIAKEVLYQEEGTKLNQEIYGLSACAGIAYFQSHFPFADAYRVAEACCSNAKKRMKALAVKNENTAFVESGLDFQICDAVSVVEDLEKYRKKHYELADGTSLLLRPYIIPRVGHTIKELPEEYEFDSFVKLQREMNSLPKNGAKRLRNAYASGEYETVLVAKQLESRGVLSQNTPIYLEQNGKKIARYFDALETMEFFIDMGREEDENETMDGAATAQ